MKMCSFRFWIGLFPVLGCASATPGARPHDMSTAAHEQQAAAHAGAAEHHTGQYDPSATTTRDRCRVRAGDGARVGDDIGDTCWKSSTNPSEKHLRQAEEHRRSAADHRAASAALRDAETRSCVGISPNDRDMSPFEHVEDIAGVEPLEERGGTTKAPSQRTAGAVVTFRAVPGLTAEWLQRVVDCHLARNSSLGHVMPEMPNCPLVPSGAEARVSSTGSGFAVAIRSGDSSSSSEILARAQRLVSPGAGGASTP